MLLFAIACMIVLEMPAPPLDLVGALGLPDVRHEEQAVRVRAVPVADLALT